MSFHQFQVNITPSSNQPTPPSTRPISSFTQPHPILTPLLTLPPLPTLAPAPRLPTLTSQAPAPTPSKAEATSPAAAPALEVGINEQEGRRIKKSRTLRQDVISTIESQHEDILREMTTIWRNYEEAMQRNRDRFHKAMQTRESNLREFRREYRDILRRNRQ